MNASLRENRIGGIEHRLAPGETAPSLPPLPRPALNSKPDWLSTRRYSSPEEAGFRQLPPSLIQVSCALRIGGSIL